MFVLFSFTIGGVHLHLIRLSLRAKPDETDPEPLWARAAWSTIGSAAAADTIYVSDLILP
jgi:hypothetical protein